MGISKCRGLRHAYAQRRYFELTQQYDPEHKGWRCPKEGGPATKSLSGAERAIEHKAREIISRTLGHSRPSIVRIYIA